MKLKVYGGCPCGMTSVEIPFYIDSGTTLLCLEGHEIVFDVSSPEDREVSQVERLQKEIQSLRVEKGLDRVKVSELTFKIRKLESVIVSLGGKLE